MLMHNYYVHVMMESNFMCITDNHIYVFYCVYSVICVLHVNLCT